MSADKISIFAPSVMRNNLISSDFDVSEIIGINGRIKYLYNNDGDRKDIIYGPNLSSGKYSMISEAILSWERSLLQMCLYSDEIWIPSIFYPMSGRQWTDRANWSRYEVSTGLGAHKNYLNVWNSHNYEICEMFDRLSPLIEAKIIKLYNPLDIYFNFVSEKLFGEKRWMTKEEVDKSWPDLFVVEGLLFAENLESNYCATTSEEYESLLNISDRISNPGEAWNNKVFAFLAHIDLPGLEIDAKSLVNARLKYEEFEDLRISIRNVIRVLQENVNDNEFRKSSRMLERDLVRPMIDKAMKKSSKSAYISKNFKSNIISFSAGAISSVLIKQDIAAALAGGAITAAARSGLQYLFEKDNIEKRDRFISSVFIRND